MIPAIYLRELKEVLYIGLCVILFSGLFLLGIKIIKFNFSTNDFYHVFPHNFYSFFVLFLFYLLVMFFRKHFKFFSGVNITSLLLEAGFVLFAIVSANSLVNETFNLIDSGNEDLYLFPIALVLLCFFLAYNRFIGKKQVSKFLLSKRKILKPKVDSLLLFFSVFAVVIFLQGIFFKQIAR